MKGNEKVVNALTKARIDDIPVLVKLGWAIMVFNKNLGFIYEVKVQENTDLA